MLNILYDVIFLKPFPSFYCYHVTCDSVTMISCQTLTLVLRIENKKEDVTNFIQLVSPQPVDRFTQTIGAGKPQMRAIYTYVGCTKATTND